jgi:hypothetical protein
MVKRRGSAPDTEPQNSFQKPSEGWHEFQVVDVIEDKNNDDVVAVKLEVKGGKEEGRTLLNRCCLDFEAKGFGFTRLFLKAIGEPCRGDIEIDTDMWIGRELKALVVHNEGTDRQTGEPNGKFYANIVEYQFDAPAEKPRILPQGYPPETAKALSDGPFGPRDIVQPARAVETAWDDDMK